MRGPKDLDNEIAFDIQQYKEKKLVIITQHTEINFHPKKGLHKLRRHHPNDYISFSTCNQNPISWHLN